MAFFHSELCTWLKLRWAGHHGVGFSTSDWIKISRRLQLVAPSGTADGVSITTTIYDVWQPGEIKGFRIVMPAHPQMANAQCQRIQREGVRPLLTLCTGVAPIEAQVPGRADDMESKLREDSEPPKRISFKYRSGPAALRSLSDGSAYFAPPSEFNDCLEAKFDHSSMADYMASMDRSIREIAEQRGTTGGYSVSAEKLAAHEEHHARESTSFLQATQRVGIYSTAGSPDNQPMWAYYCDNSKGFCFEVEWINEVLGQYQLMPTGVLYSSAPRVHNRADIFGKLLREEAELHPDWSMGRLLEETRSQFFMFRFNALNTCRAVSIKHSDWAHEKEVRLIAPRSGPLPIMKQILRRVYFVRTDFPEFVQVLAKLHQDYPDVELVQLSFQHTESYVDAKQVLVKLIPVSELLERAERNTEATEE